MRRVVVATAFAVLAASVPLSALAQTRFEHNSLPYVVPGKRVQITANVTDPKGVRLTRVYFRTPAQADYVFVPMTAAGANRYVATVPALNASAPSLEYVLLAVNNGGEVSKTREYTAFARQTQEAPAWQNTSRSGDLKVYTEAATAPQTVAGFSDSISMDVAESTARFGGAAGLLASGGGGGAGAGATTGTSSSTAGTTSATAATTGGLSTIAIVGGVAVAGLAAAAASGGGGGGSSSSPQAPASFAGTWQAKINLPSGSSVACQDTPEPFELTIDAQNNVTVLGDGGSNPTTTVASNGAISGSVKTIFWGTCSFSGTLSTSGTGGGNANCNGIAVPPFTGVCTPGQSGPWTATRF